MSSALETPLYFPASDLLSGVSQDNRDWYARVATCNASNQPNYVMHMLSRKQIVSPACHGLHAHDHLYDRYYGGFFIPAPFDPKSCWNEKTTLGNGVFICVAITNTMSLNLRM